MFLFSPLDTWINKNNWAKLATVIWSLIVMFTSLVIAFAETPEECNVSNDPDGNGDYIYTRVIIPLISIISTIFLLFLLYTDKLESTRTGRIIGATLLLFITVFYTVYVFNVKDVVCTLK
jgi:hypothetical protein